MRVPKARENRLGNFARKQQGVVIFIFQGGAIVPGCPPLRPPLATSITEKHDIVIIDEEYGVIRTKPPKSPEPKEP